MFNLVEKKDNICIIYKSGLVDAARCIIKGKNDEIAVTASAELDNMFMEMVSAFERNSVVKMYHLKHKDSVMNLFEDINEFKVWLIQNQTSDNIRLVLDKLKTFCKKHKIELPSINIVFGEACADAIFNTDMYFNNTYDREWLDIDLMKKMIKDIDKSEVIDSFAIKSPVFGIMPVEKLSGGAKTLMLIYNNPEMIFNASTCGDNCAKWIKKFAEEKDFVINLYHAMEFPNGKINAYIVNGREIIHSMDEIYVYADKYCRS